MPINWIKRIWVNGYRQFIVLFLSVNKTPDCTERDYTWSLAVFLLLLLSRAGLAKFYYRVANSVEVFQNSEALTRLKNQTLYVVNSLRNDIYISTIYSQTESISFCSYSYKEKVNLLLNLFLNLNKTKRYYTKIEYHLLKSINTATMITSEKNTQNLEEIRKSIEIIVQKNSVEAEIEEFCIEIADKNLKTKEEVKTKIIEYCHELGNIVENPEVFVKQKNTIKGIKITLNSAEKLAYICDNYWEYFLPDIKERFLQIYWIVSDQNTNQKTTNRKTLTNLKLNTLILFGSILNCQNLFQRMDTVINKLMKSIKEGIIKDEEDRIDWELSSSSLKDSEFFDWDEFKDDFESYL